ncbi:MAG: hypothetical protein HY319_12870 [Armatimonadetes bacterium]|nr:hypothetical protein [Armatimonadota bacterium]
MKKVFSALAILLVVGGTPAVAEESSCIKDAIMLGELKLTRQPGETLLVEPQRFDYIPNMEALKLDLKQPSVPAFDAEFSVTIDNNLRPGAGYSSPYLWEVGQGPGVRQGPFTLSPMHPGYLRR